MEAATIVLAVALVATGATLAWHRREVLALRILLEQEWSREEDELDGE